MSLWARSYPWQLRCVVDSVRAVVPFQPQLRRFQDQILGYRRDPKGDTETIRWGLTMLEWLGSVEGLTVLEIGSGWQPVIPILFSLAGAKVYMTDQYRLMREDSFGAALDAIRENRDEIARRLKISPDAVDRATSKGLDMTQHLSELRLSYQAPCDCRYLPLDSGSIDLITSRSVLEHVPPPVIDGIFREAKRVLRPGGIMMHVIDNSDHWAHRDERISAVNFLKYSDRVFRLTCINPLDYTNRLRHSEYLVLIEASGFTLKRKEAMVDPICLEALSSMSVAKQFRHFQADDLAATTSMLLAEAPPQPLAEN